MEGAWHLHAHGLSSAAEQGYLMPWRTAARTDRFEHAEILPIGGRAVFCIGEPLLYANLLGH